MQSESRKFPSTFQLIPSLLAFLISFTITTTQAKAEWNQQAAEPSFPAGRDVVSLPFKLLNNHIYVRANLNYSAPHLMMLDTAASLMLDSRFAAALGLHVYGHQPVQGAGTNSPDSSNGMVRTINLGGIVFRNLPAVVFNATEQKQVEGVDDMAGYLGWEILAHSIVRIDYPNRTLTFFKRGQFRPTVSENRLPLTFLNRLPEVDAAIAGNVGHFVLDTGSRASLLLLPPFAKRIGATPCTGVEAPIIGWGLTGPDRAPRVTIPEIILGHLSLKNVDAALTSGNDAPPVDGNIGGAFLRDTVVTLDFEQSAAWVDKADRFGTVDRVDHSGIWINRVDGHYRIVDVARSSVSDALGLVVGDEIFSVEGIAAEQMGLSAIRERLTAKPGSVVHLTIRHGQILRSVAMTLQSLPEFCHQPQD